GTAPTTPGSAAATGTSTLAAERNRHLSTPIEVDRPGRDPEAMEAEAAKVRAEESALREALTQAQTALTAAVAGRQGFEQALADAEKALVAAARAVADRREGLAKLQGQVNALRTRAGAAAAEIARLSGAAEQARDRAASAEAELERVQDEVGALDEGEVGLDEQHETAVSRYEALAARRRELLDLRQVAEKEQSTWSARRDALAMGLTRKDGAGALLAAGSRLPGVLGSVAALLSVQPGHEAALAAALGALADAVAVNSPRDAADALLLLKEQDSGRAGLLIGSGPTQRPGAGPDRSEWPSLPAGSSWAADVVTAPPALAATVAEALDRVAIVEDLEAAHRLVTAEPTVRAVTPAGDVLGRGFAVGGSASAPSALEIQAAVDEAATRANEAAGNLTAAQTELSDLDERLAGLKAEVDRTLIALNESDARLSAVTEQLAELGQQARSAHAEAQRLEASASEAGMARDRDLAGLAELEERLELASEAGDDEHEPSTSERDEARNAVATARQSEMDARLAVRTAEERVRALSGRADGLERAATQERAARRRHEQVRVARRRGAMVAQAVHSAAQSTLLLIAASLERATVEREEVQTARATRDKELAEVRTMVRELSAKVERLTDAVHRDEVLRAEQRLRIESLQQRAIDEYGVEPDALVAEYGPDQPVPPSSLETAEFEQARDRGEEVVAPQPGAFHRPTQEKRAARADRDLALLGKVNPLALEEFAALEERHQFLSTQLEDIKDTRRDLMTVVREVDERILAVFTAAYHDVAREFEIVFSTLFPGGEGRLILTNPDDMLLTGIDVEARPPGKKVKRLSLLSGGERSLTAVALLVAIFRARPSPFYIMDEVEAALDDVNLGRLISLIGELRASSQLIIITHQKRTMEIADALYGVTMRGDGITQVISQRLRERDDAGPLKDDSFAHEREPEAASTPVG
ncbi:MAG: chromosome segregation protein, partial [Pseudonocardiales bacterium]|nr:chromosome segregation protein [Pseudonocardiales bacterium]